MADCEKLIDETVKAFGGLDVIIGNAVGSHSLTKYLWKAIYDAMDNVQYTDEL